MKGITKKLACHMLVFSLLITSITTAYINKPKPVEGAEIAIAYTVEEVILAIMAGLGLAVADYGINASHDDLEDAKAWKAEMDANTEYWTQVEKEYLDKAIEKAQTTGKVVIDKASGVWDKLKTEFGNLIDKFRSPDIDESEYEAYYDMNNFDNSSGNLKFYNYLSKTVQNMFANCGIDTQCNYNYSTAKYFYDLSSSENYYVLFSALDYVNGYTVKGCVFHSVADMVEFTSILRKNATSTTSQYANNYTFFSFTSDGAYKNYGNSLLGRLIDIHILNPSEADFISETGISKVTYKDNYDIVYHPPTVGDVTHAYDIITPENTAEKDEDGTYKIGGAYVIDVANPVTYPVDLTDGQTIADEKSEIGTIPITDIVKENEKTDTGNEDNKTEDSDNTGGTTTKPIAPDVSSGDIPDMSVLKTLFPFCIPFDIADSIKLMQADAVAPKWEIKIDIPVGKKTIPFEFTVDMSILDEQVKIFRDGQVLIFIIGLAFATTKVIKWGASEE